MDGLLRVVMSLALARQVAYTEAKFDFTVRFYDYWNPTGLCAECGTNGVPVCCDDPQRTESCRNTGVLRCDNRFRFIQRPFNASLETAPSGSFPYFTRGITNENHHTFPEGPGGFLSLPNPYTSVNTSAWTGRTQFLVDAFDRINNNLAPNETEGIVDRFIVNLDQLQLGADLSERATYAGIYRISTLAMSFRVACSENYYGSDCATFCESVEGVYTCDSDGNIIRVCVDDNRDPSAANCTSCLSGWDLSSNCTTCSHGYTGRMCSAVGGNSEGKPDMHTSRSLIGGIAGGVVTILLVILIATVTLTITVKKCRKKSTIPDCAASSHGRLTSKRYARPTLPNTTPAVHVHVAPATVEAQSSPDVRNPPYGTVERVYHEYPHTWLEPAGYVETGREERIADISASYIDVV